MVWNRGLEGRGEFGSRLPVETTFLFGFRYTDGERYEDPDAPSGSPGSRLPLLPPDADPVGYELTVLTASPDWAREAERAAAAAGVDVCVRLVPDTGWTGRARIGAQGAVLVRPDRYIAWRSQEPPRAAPPLAALREVFDC